MVNRPPFATDLESSAESFFDAAGEFFSNLAAIGWLALAGALALYLGMLLCRARAWQNTLRVAYPDSSVPFKGIAAAFIAGAGINAVAPARAGDAAKIVLARGQVRGSTYPALTSSFAVQSVFDTSVGLLVLAYALTQGLLPSPPELPRLPAFEISFWAAHPHALLFVLTLLATAFVVGFAVLARHVELFWQRIRQGARVLAAPRRFLAEVAAWQGAGWLFRFGSLWLFLEAFNVGGSFQNVLLVMSVQAVATLLPFTPGGAGAQQALLVATLESATAATILSYSVGQQLAIAAWTAVLGAAALYFVFRRTDWREVIREGTEAAQQSAAAETSPA